MYKLHEDARDELDAVPRNRAWAFHRIYGVFLWSKKGGVIA